MMINEWQHLADEIERLSSDLKDKTVKLDVANDVIDKLRAEIARLHQDYRDEAQLRIAGKPASER